MKKTGLFLILSKLVLAAAAGAEVEMLQYSLARLLVVEIAVEFLETVVVVVIVVRVAMFPAVEVDYGGCSHATHLPQPLQRQQQLLILLR